MKFRIEHTPQEILEDPDLGPMTPRLTILMGDKKDPPDYDFHLPDDADLAEYDKYIYEVMEGIFGGCDNVTEDQIRTFLLSKGFEETK
jgi:hypothetical protein